MPRMIYLAGPMTGYPDHNYPAFNRAAAKLRAAGDFVFNPAESFMPEGYEDFESTEAFHKGECPPELYAELLAEDLEFICRDATAIALLPGWSNSKGARAERAVAEALGLVVILLTEDGTPINGTADYLIPDTENVNVRAA
jgi:hypothetical protein